MTKDEVDSIWGGVNEVKTHADHVTSSREKMQSSKGHMSIAMVLQAIRN